MSLQAQAEKVLQQAQEQVFALGEALLQNPELGFKEYKTQALLAEYLQKEGIPYQDQLSLTGLRATLGKGGYHIALVADMDAVSVISQGESKACHSCGHSLQMAVMMAVLTALHRGGFVDDLGGRVSFIATPAEEYIDLAYREELRRQGKIRYYSGKQNMIADGVFDDVDCALSVHVTGEPGVQFDIGSTLAGFTVKKAVWKGLGAHSGALSHQGRNALHAASLCLQACSFLQEQFPPVAGLQLHPILTEGGSTMNIIPERAVMETYVRANTKEYLFEASSKFDQAAKACGRALGIDCEIEDTVGYMPLRQSDGLNAVVEKQVRNYSTWPILKNFASGASGDMGDLGFLLPSVQMGFTGFSGRIHSDTFGVADPQLAYMTTAKIMLGTVLDLLSQPDLQIKNPSFRQDKAYYLKSWLRQE